MSDPLSDFGPVPAEPLAYYQATSSAWTTPLQIICVISAIFTGIAVAVDLVGLMFQFTQFGMIPPFAFNSPWSATFYMSLPLILVRMIMFIGCIIAPRFEPAGWHLVVWSSAISIVVALVVMMVGLSAYNAAVSRNGSFTSPTMLRYIVSSIGNFCRGAFPAALLLYFFCRGEARAMFRR